MGYGIAGGVFQTRYTQDIIEDLIDQKSGKTIPGQFQIQIPKIEEMDFDWSTIIKDGQQVQTVGNHWVPFKVTDQRDQRCDGAYRTVYGVSPGDVQQRDLEQGI